MTFQNNCDGGFFSNHGYVNVAMTHKCENNCIYCIAKARKDYGDPDPEKIADSILHINYDEVVIEGGEPLLYPKETETVIDFIRPYIPTINIFTSLPENLNSQEGYCKFVDILQKCDGINISIRHYNHHKAYQIARSPAPVSDWRLKFIKRLCNNKLNDKFRISLELCKDWLDTEQELKDCLVNFIRMGVKNIKISELNSFPELFVPIEKVMPIKLNSNIIADGCSTYIDKPPESWNCHNLFMGCSVLLKRTCGLIQTHHVITSKDKLKLKIRDFKDHFIPRRNYRIVFPDGHIEDSW